MAEALFDRARYESRLATRWLGRHVVARDLVGSTNDVAWEAFAQGGPDGLVAVADAQHQGRGRGGRFWQTAPGMGLAMSLLLREGCDARPLGILPLAVGLALVQALEGLGVHGDLKWPNDVLVNGAKISGILCESRGAAAAGSRAVVIGVGVNVSQTREDFAGQVRERATSLALAGHDLDRETVAAELLNRFEPLWIDLEDRGAAPIVAAWRGSASFWGQPVRVRTPAGELAGVATTLDDEGRLMLRLESGEQVSVVAGDLEVGITSGEARRT